jgi:RNA polymerase sigma-70 factor (ECF subfamily)
MFQEQADQLLLRARGGCVQSQGELLERYRKYLKALVRVQLHRSLAGRADASDLVQETFLRAYEQFAQFRGATEAQLVGWLRSILASRLSKLVRRHTSARRSVELERRLTDELDRSSMALDRALVLPDSTPSEKAVRTERVVLLASAIEDLPDDYRSVILLRHVEGLSYADVAAAMGRSVDSVKKLWVRALARLKRDMEAWS